MKLSTREGAILGIIRLNEKFWAQERASKMRITREWNPFSSRLRIKFSWRSKKCMWGRFGGGWQWALGFESASTCIIFNLLICHVRVSWYKEKEAQ